LRSNFTISNFFETAVLLDEYTATLAEHTAVNRICDVTDRGFFSHTAVHKQKTAVIYKNRGSPRFPFEFFSVGAVGMLSR
jgi:hypothetical protein